ncbi:MAG: ABC transporter permease [Acidobacteria bacterium]|nr:ABC transporter permease [Acidobacteriota bacterium]
MTFEMEVALRYLRSPHKPVVLRLITLLSIIGIAAGVATLVIALAVNAGFRRVLQERLLGVTAHVNLTRTSSEGIRDYPALREKLLTVPGVRSVTPAIYQTVLLASGTRARGIVVKGVEPTLERESNDALRQIQGGADFAADKDGIEAVLLGHVLAQELKVSKGDYVTLTSPTGRLTPFGMVPRSRRFRITGIFNSGFYDYDANWGFVSLTSAQNLAGVGDVVNVMEFRLAKLDQAEEIARAAASRAGAGFSTTTWMDQNRALFRALRLEKLVTAIFIGLITFVAGLNVLVVLAMTVTDKARDIAVLMAVGARREQIRGIFFWQGLTVGLAGTVIGLAVGYGISFMAGHWQLLPLDPEIYAVPFVPFDANGVDALWITIASLTICGGATLLPACAAARILPVEILRYE